MSTIGCDRYAILYFNYPSNAKFELLARATWNPYLNLFANPRISLPRGGAKWTSPVSPFGNTQHALSKETGQNQPASRERAAGGWRPPYGLSLDPYGPVLAKAIPYP